MNGLKKCVMSSIKDFRIVKLVFFVFTVILLFDELRKEFMKKTFFTIKIMYISYICSS